MKESTAANQIINSVDPRSISIFGYELIRETLLPEILGKDTPEILYWAGKLLARKYPIDDYDQLVEFFEQASWGQLELKNESKNEMEFELISPLIVSRIKTKAEQFFQLEAGFLAQQIEQQKQVITETFEHPNKKSNKVRFTVKWDQRDAL